MAQTLAESFLADLEELSDEEQEQAGEDNGMEEDELDKVRLQGCRGPRECGP